MTELDGCIIWCSRVLIPPQAHEHILAELHGGHLGGARMKSLARRYVWWPGMDRQIEETVKACPECQQTQPAPLVAPLSGLPGRGHWYTLILPDRWTVTHILSVSMHIRNGLKYLR